MLLHNFCLLFHSQGHDTKHPPVEQGSKHPGDLVHLQDVVTNLSPKDLL